MPKKTTRAIPAVPTFNQLQAIAYLCGLYPKSAQVEVTDKTSPEPRTRVTSLAIACALIKQFEEYAREDYIAFDSSILHFTAIESPAVKVELYRQPRLVSPDPWKGECLFSLNPEDTEEKPVQ